MHRNPNNQYEKGLHRALSPVNSGDAAKDVMRQIEQFVRPRQDDDGEETDILIPQYPLRLFEICHAMRVMPPKSELISLSKHNDFAISADSIVGIPV